MKMNFERKREKGILEKSGWIRLNDMMCVEIVSNGDLGHG